MLLSADHIDLLISAAEQWKLLPSHSPHALAGHRPRLAETPASAAELLASHVALETATYRFQPVRDLAVLEVIKACHGYEMAAVSSRAPSSRRARRLVDQILRAATERLPGYAAAPQVWRRGPSRTGAPVGLNVSGSWRPELPLTWLTDPGELRRLWSDARLIVLTAEAAGAAAELAPRPDVYVVARTADLDETWPGITSSCAEVLVTLPAGQSWIEERIDDAQLALSGTHTVSGVGSARD